MLLIQRKYTSKFQRQLDVFQLHKVWRLTFNQKVFLEKYAPHPGLWAQWLSRAPGVASGIPGQGACGVGQSRHGACRRQPMDFRLSHRCFSLPPPSSLSKNQSTVSLPCPGAGPFPWVSLTAPSSVRATGALTQGRPWGRVLLVEESSEGMWDAAFIAHR